MSAPDLESILPEKYVGQDIGEALSSANISPQTGLATNYLNHFVEVVLLLEMLPDMLECVEDIDKWKPKSYISHVRGSELPHMELICAAFEQANPTVKQRLAVASANLNVFIQEKQRVTRELINEEDYGVLRGSCEKAAAEIRDKIDELSAIIRFGEVKSSYDFQASA